MGQTRTDDRYRVDTIRRKKTFERAKERVGATGVQLGEASPCVLRRVRFLLVT